MKTRIITLLLALCLVSVAAMAQKTKANTFFTGKWQLTALVHKTLSPDEMSKTYEFSKDSVLQMKSSRYQITGKYTFDEKTAQLTIDVQGNVIVFRIIFLSPDKMQWHAVAAQTDDDDGIIERVPAETE